MRLEVIFFPRLPLFSEALGAAPLGPAAVPESDWDLDEQPGISSLLDIWNKSCKKINK